MNKQSPPDANADVKLSLVRPNQAMHEIRLDAARRIVAYAKTGKTDLAPEVELADASFYTDASTYEREVRRLFRETPLVACLSKDVPEPGSYRLFDEPGVPIVVVRGKDNKVRAFLNVCRHRGARIFREPSGKANRFSCRFHGWTYDTLGEVVGVPEEQYFCGQIDNLKHLIAVPAEERHGFVFVLATPGATMDLDAHLAGIGSQLEPLDMAQATCVIDETFTNPSDWKYTMVTYMENYHLPVLHRESFGGIFAKNLNIFETWGAHHRFIWPQETIYDWMNKPETEWLIDALPLTHFIFPNLHMAVGGTTPNGSSVSIHRLFPKSPTEMIARVTIYAPYGVQSEAHLAEIKKSYEVAKRAFLHEDFSVTGEAHAALTALPAGTAFAVGRHEIAVQNFHRNVRRVVGA